MALGEIGLDYYYDDNAPREIQRLIFEQQLALAKDLDVPVIIHNRDAHQDTLELLKKVPAKGHHALLLRLGRGGQGGAQAGDVHRLHRRHHLQKRPPAVEAAAEVPLDRLLIETDCPYMAPEPYRGKRCDSTMLPRMAEKLAEIKGVSPQRLADQTLLRMPARFTASRPPTWPYRDREISSPLLCRMTQLVSHFAS